MTLETNFLFSSHDVFIHILATPFPELFYTFNWFIPACLYSPETMRHDRKVIGFGV